MSDSEAQWHGAQRVIDFFETLTLESLHHADLIYTENAYFKDPFNEVRGSGAIKKIFRHMFDQVDRPRFVVRESAIDADNLFLTWDFYFRMKRFNRTEQCIKGSSHLRLTIDGRVSLHRDYWDAAEELYEKLPLLGSLMRMLKRRART